MVFLADINLAGFSIVGEGASLWVLIPELLFALAALYINGGIHLAGPYKW